MSKDAADNVPDRSVPAPGGRRGISSTDGDKKYNLQDSMGIDEDDPLYDDIQVSDSQHPHQSTNGLYIGCSPLHDSGSRPLRKEVCGD